MKKIAIIGAGTAGCYGATHFSKWTDWKIDWYFDPNLRAQAVGEGAGLFFPENLYSNIKFDNYDLYRINGTHKHGIHKINWGTNQKEFTHIFPPGKVSYHFSASEFQEYIIKKIRSTNRINIKEEHVKSHDDLDVDFILDCSGKPKDLSLFQKPKYIPVNSVYVTQCFWESPRLDVTMAIAKPYGWVFCIPLQNRCSVGYLYNNQFNSLEEIKEDVKSVFQELNLIPSEVTNKFTFDNYYRKHNFSKRIAYNGNSSFFLEPLEATSIWFMNKIQRSAWDIWNNNSFVDLENKNYIKNLIRIEELIMIHYAAGSPFKSNFWNFAENLGKECFKNMTSWNSDFNDWYHSSPKENFDLNSQKEEYGPWTATSFNQHFQFLNLDYKIL